MSLPLFGPYEAPSGPPLRAYPRLDNQTLTFPFFLSFSLDRTLVLSPGTARSAGGGGAYCLFYLSLSLTHSLTHSLSLSLSLTHSLSLSLSVSLWRRNLGVNCCGWVLSKLGGDGMWEGGRKGIAWAVLGGWGVPCAATTISIGMHCSA